MDPIILFAGASTFQSSADAVNYVNTHLMGSTEAGSLRRLERYLDAGLRVVPVYLNRDLWQEVGLSPEARQIPERLISNLCQGMDLGGRQLARIALCAPARELILTFHCEISEAIEPYPEVGFQTLRAMALEALAYLEARAIRIRQACGLREWHKARMLGALYCHARNKEDEPHFHGHLMVFPIAREARLGWRVYHDQAAFLGLNEAGGLRSRVGKVARRELARHGFDVQFQEGLASLSELNGATVRCPDGRLIEAGSVVRARTSIIWADKLLKEFLGTAPLTTGEVGLVHAHGGQFAEAIPEIANDKRLIAKLHQLNLLDTRRRIHSGIELDKAIQSIDNAMSMTQASVLELSHQSTAQMLAVIEALRSKRMELREAFSQCLPSEPKPATALWSTSVSRILQKAAVHGNEGMNIEALGATEHDIFLALIRAQLLGLDASTGRRAVRLTEFGRQKLDQLETRMKAASLERFEKINQIPWPVDHVPTISPQRKNEILNPVEPKVLEPEIKHERATISRRR